MRFVLKPNREIRLDRVRAGAATDARWRECLGPAYQGRDEDGDQVYRIDSTIAHEIEMRAEGERDVFSNNRGH
jgi:hypothetical protein